MNATDFCADLIRCKSVTPNDDGAIGRIADFLSAFGAETEILTFRSADGGNVVTNLFAKYGNSERKILGFLGHSDVVPAGDGWETDPFEAVRKDGFLIGRGAADMKGGIAAFCCAAARFAERPFDGTVEFFITGDEEKGSPEGIRSLIDSAVRNNRIPRDCLIGEPSSDLKTGDRIYIGHRGSMNVTVKSRGRQGHSAYPAAYKNSLSALCKYIAKIADFRWKHENQQFPTTNAEATMLFTDNYAVNVVPELSSANLNIRFGDDYTIDELKELILREAEGFEGLSFDFSVSGEAYCCNSEELKTLAAAAVKETIGVDPVFSTAGGTSDGRHMIRFCNVIELGLPDSTIHQKNEKIKIEDLENLEKIYLRFLEKYFA
ncbi:MAG: succinyl-diaminopimelate desuccinylase [Holosporaceae bacterium]|jgi:succinyl-diaminopimelate desuccinylase|nr:succinyl-diaminopimelate desuccinylase [Holosporaceae bacterium]